jgi:Ca2+-binding EF-hand superfamily protein
MFTLFDPSGRGTISQDQVATACRSLGLKKQVTIDKAEINVDIFIRAMRAALDDERR